MADAFRNAAQAMVAQVGAAAGPGPIIRMGS
jgi:hypothetical protein